jgi:hypothetical protein
MAPRAFEQMWHEREKYDFLIGIRHNRHAPFARKVVSMISRSTVWFFYGKGIKDVNSPYRLMRNSVFAVVFQQIPNDTFAPNLIISGMAIKLKCRILQSNVDFNERQTGEVSIKKWKLFKVSVKSLIQTSKYSINK